MNNRTCCAECGAVFMPWDAVYRWQNGKLVCGECFDNKVKELRREELADSLGCEVLYAEELKS